MRNAVICFINIEIFKKGSADIVLMALIVFTTWAEHVARRGEKRVEYRILVGKSEGRRPLGRSRLIWEDNTKWIFAKWDVGHGLNLSGSG